MWTSTNRPLSPEWHDRRVAIVGYGSIGRRHAENLRTLGVGSIVLVRRSDGANAAFTPPDAAIVVHDASAAIGLGVSAAIICTPTSLHVQDATPFVAAGVPVLVEKPLAAEAASAKRLDALAARHQAMCGTAYCMRYHPAYAAARDVIRQGTLGRVTYAKAWFESWLPGWHPWEDYRQSYAAKYELGGGVLPTLDHEIDFLNWCLGQPQRVTGERYCSHTLESNVDDLASLVLEYPGGVTAHCLLSLCRQDRQRGFEFIGSQGSLRYCLETGQLLLFRERGPQEQLWSDAAYDVNDMYKDMMADFLNCVGAGQMPPTPLSAGVAALEVCAQVRSRSAG